MAQEAINYLLAEKAREGKTVARLKWGDPFVFDRGGEEALFLHEQGVPFEVIPGVPAAIAAPAYAGVPVSYPGGGDTITLVRGYEDQSRTPPEIDWASLAQLGGTVVCYAGPQQLPRVLESLVSHGWPDETQAVAVYNAHDARPGDDLRDDRRTAQDAARDAAPRAGDARRRPRRRPARRICGGTTSARCSAAACS